MIIPGTGFLNKVDTKYWLALMSVVVVFLISRLPGLGLPYHQDEWKNVIIASDLSAGSYWTHPPLFQILFNAASYIFGVDYFRIFPLIFSIGTAILLYLVLKRRTNSNVALWSVCLFTVCFYNILGSLMPDVDGAIIPFFFLLAVYSYDRFIDSNQSEKWKLFVALVVVCLIGFLIKLNFILVIGALLVDYVWMNRKLITLKSAMSIVAVLAVFGVVYIALLYLIQAIYPSFSIEGMLGHANQFSSTAGRNWMQIAVQSMKALFYLSPLLIVPILLVSKEIFNKYRILFVYLIIGLFFYIILFDFSRGALDKYLMYSIVPLAVIVGAVFEEVFKRVYLDKIKWALFFGVIVSSVLVILNFLPQTVVALYPKTEWFARVIHGDWDVLTPFTGGSGPMGVYISFLFIAVSYIVSAVLALVGLFKGGWRPRIAVILLVMGVTYNAVFAEELLIGKINGSAITVLKNTVSYIRSSTEIDKVLTFNDTGTQYLSAIDKYGGRFYATPDFEEGHKKKFADFRYYLVVDIPHLYEDGFYGKFFATCKIMYETKSGKISGRVYDCEQSRIDR